MAGPSDSPPPSFEAEYTLETALPCPLCKTEISTVQVVRLLRTRVNFVSMMPRRGHVIVCPACRGIVTAALGGFA